MKGHAWNAKANLAYFQQSVANSNNLAFQCPYFFKSWSLYYKNYHQRPVLRTSGKFLNYVQVWGKILVSEGIIP